MLVTHQILLTSFQPWLSHHHSNSSDQLLERLEKLSVEGINLRFLRQLPVNIDQSFYEVYKMLQAQKPHGVICCGMAENRETLTLESCAFWQSEKRATSINLTELSQFLSDTQISHDAGKFVCEGLYYHVLKYCQELTPSIPCLFVHVPLLTEANINLILKDFELILQHFINHHEDNYPQK